MAEQPITQIAQELQRIENAKQTLLSKGIDLSLVYTDQDGGQGLLNENSNLDVIAAAFEEIPEWGTDGLEVTLNRVTAKKGYYPDNTEVSVGTVERAETQMSVEVDEYDETGESFLAVHATNAQESGYVIKNVDCDAATRIIHLDIDGKTAQMYYRDDPSVKVEKDLPDGEYSVYISGTPDICNISEDGDSITYEKVSTRPSNLDDCFYLKVTAQGRVNVTGQAIVTKDGYLPTGEKSEETLHYSKQGEAWYILPNADVPISIDPLEETEIQFSEGYTKSGKVEITGHLLERLQAI